MRPETKAYNTTLANVLAIVSELDPYGLEPRAPGGAPPDEYDPEARDIVRVLFREGQVTIAQLDAIWLHWFSEPLTGRESPERMHQFLVSLNSLDG